MSRDEGELLTVQMPRAVGSLPVCLSVKPVGEPDALIGHVRFDERGWETERRRMAQATAPILDSTIATRCCGASTRSQSGRSGHERRVATDHTVVSRVPHSKFFSRAATRGCLDLESAEPTGFPETIDPAPGFRVGPGLPAAPAHAQGQRYRVGWRFRA